jgi:lactoylglutathione lyase
MYDVAHIGLAVQDAEKSCLFYEKVLGCQKDFCYQDERVKIINMKAGNQIIELVQYLQEKPTQRTAGPVDHIAFFVEDIDAAVATLRENNVTLLSAGIQTVLDGKRVFFFAGPDGERLEFFQEVLR